MQERNPIRERSYVRMHEKNKNVIAITILIMTLLSAAVCNSISVEAAEHTEKSVTVSIPVSCEKVDSEETFQYQIKGAPSEFEEIIQTELGLKSGEKGYFQISYSYPGTYYYTVSQIAGADKKTTYDSTEYQVDVCVIENEEGKLFAQPILYLQGSDEKKAELVFKNTRKVEKPSQNNPDTVKGKTETRQTKQTKQKVKTGDATDLLQWSVILGASGILLILAFWQKYRRRGEEKEHE